MFTMKNRLKAVPRDEVFNSEDLDDFVPDSKPHDFMFNQADYLKLHGKGSQAE